jgi:hypothetical protein
MKVAELSKIDHLHHAYIVSGENGAHEVLEMLKKRGVEVKTNADVLQLTYSEMLVDDARSIASYAFLKSVGESKYFIITFSRANDAAQNALLKVVEEAPGNTIFFFCVEALGHLLPTLRSRCVSVTAGDEVDPSTGSGQASIEEAQAFIKKSYADRLTFVDKLIAQAKKDDDKTHMRAFVRELVIVGHTAKLAPTKMRDLLNAESYLRLQGASPKSILSHLAIVL